MSFSEPSSSRNSRLIHDKRVPNIVTSQCEIILSPFLVFSSQWATLEAHSFKTIMNVQKILKPSNSAHQKLYFETKKKGDQIFGWRGWGTLGSFPFSKNNCCFTSYRMTRLPLQIELTHTVFR